MRDSFPGTFISLLRLQRKEDSEGMKKAIGKGSNLICRRWADDCAVGITIKTKLNHQSQFESL